jgi:hypothetical protein
MMDLIVGQVYRVRITDVYPGKVEFMLGNQYLLAATRFQFNTGDMVNLKLIDRNPQLLTFQLTLPGLDQQGTAGTQQANQQLGAMYNADIATLMRAAGLPDTGANRAAITILLQGGVEVTNRTLGEIQQLMNAVPPEAMAAFLPFYKELTERKLRIGPQVMQQLALLMSGKPELSAMLLGALNKFRAQKEKDRGSLLDQAVEAAVTCLESEDDLPTAAVLKEKLRLLYGSPEKMMREVLMTLQQAHEASPEAAEIPPPAPAQTQAEFGDLMNIALGEEVPIELASVLNLLQAMRVLASLDPRELNLILPLEIHGEPVDVELTINVIAEQYYQRDYKLRIRVDDKLQGPVEFQLRTRGPGLYLSVYVEDTGLVGLYEEQATRFREGLAERSGYYLKQVEVRQQSL